MNYTDILRTNPYLKKCNINNICDRFLAKTNGNAFVVFNNVNRNYEIHTIEAYYLSGSSYNTTVTLDLLNENTILDCLCQDFANNLDEILSNRERAEHWIEHFNEHKRSKELDQQLKTIERVMGTRQ